MSTPIVLGESVASVVLGVVRASICWAQQEVAVGVESGAHWMILDLDLLC